MGDTTPAWGKAHSRWKIRVLAHWEKGEKPRRCCGALAVAHWFCYPTHVRRSNFCSDGSQRQKRSQAEGHNFCRTRVYFLTSAGTVLPAPRRLPS